MARSPLTEPARVSKRKGARSVATLTPSQLERKRANDREAQRAIRARTKSHIERLEKELSELRSSIHRDKTIQSLMRKNRDLENELIALKKAYGISSDFTLHGLPTPPPMASSRTSSFAGTASDFGPASGFGTPFLPPTEPSEPWSAVPGPTISNMSSRSVTSSPLSTSTGPPDEYMAYLSTTMPPNMMSGAALPPPPPPPPTSAPSAIEAKVECEDMGPGKALLFMGSAAIDVADQEVLGADHEFVQHAPTGPGTPFGIPQQWPMCSQNFFQPSL